MTHRANPGHYLSSNNPHDENKIGELGKSLLPRGLNPLRRETGLHGPQQPQFTQTYIQDLWNPGPLLCP